MPRSRSARPEPARARGVVARALPALLTAGALAGCSGAVEIDSPVAGEDRATCADFVADLPDTLAEQESRDVEPDDAPGAAYGDPAIVVTCGVPVPEEFDSTQACESVDGVGWYVPQSVFEAQDDDATLTAAGYRPVVEVRVPGEYRPEGVAAAMAGLADAVTEHLELVEPCE